MLFFPLGLACTRLGIQVQLLVVFFNKTDHKNVVHQSELVSLLLILSQVIYILEYIALIYGFFRFLKYVRSKMTKEDDPESPTIDLEKWKTKVNKCFMAVILPSCNDCSCSRIYLVIVYIILILAGLFQIAISIAPPTFLIVWRNVTITSYEYSHILGDINAALSFLSHVFNFIIRVAMIVVTITIRILWDRWHPTTVVEFYDEYKKIGKFVAALQSIFQEWFVLKWIAYFLNIIGDITLAIKVLFHVPVESDSLLSSQHVFIFVTLHLVYDFVAFTTIFICGTLMNTYHRKYYRKSEKAIWKACNEGKRDEGIRNMVAESSKYKFTPSMCGLTVPLNNAGYIITFALAIVGFITSILTTFVKV